MSRLGLLDLMFDPIGERGADPVIAVTPVAPCRAAAAGDPWALSHELRTPLNAILGGVELLLDGSAGPLSHAARACLGDVQAAGRQLMRDVQDLLLLAQIRERSLPVDDQPVDLVALLRAAHACLWPAGGAPLLEIAPADARLMIRGAPAELQALAGALIDLAAGSSACPLSLRVERHPAGSRLVLSWVTCDAARLAPIRVALIVAVLELHGGVMGLLDAGGCWLDWPARRVC
jgi:signal transduction histidine kinase